MTESSSSSRRAARPGSRRPRSNQGRSQAPLVELTAIATPPELILFNAYLAAEKDLERERQRVRTAEIAREKAAARLKELKASSAGRDEIAAAEQQWREAHEAEQRIKSGEPAEKSGEPADAAEQGTDEDAEATSDEATAGEAPSEGSAPADDAPADDAPADDAPEAEASAEAEAAAEAEAEAEAPAEAEAEAEAEAPAEPDPDSSAG